MTVNKEINKLYCLKCYANLNTIKKLKSKHWKALQYLKLYVIIGLIIREKCHNE